MLKQFIVTSSAGKRLIGKAVAAHPAVQAALKKGTLVIIAGTTNGYVAEEIFKSLGRNEGFSRAGFVRGATFPPGGRPPKADFPGDLVLVDGAWQKGKTIFDVAGGLQAGDVVIKGANAVDVARRRAGVLIGHPECGTAGAALPVVVGRRVRMIIPVGLEKRVLDDMATLAEELNSPEASGPRFLPLPGEVITELDAIAALSGAAARVVAGGGVCGAEGCVWLAVKGTAQQVEAAEKLIQSIAAEPPYGQ